MQSNWREHIWYLHELKFIESGLHNMKCVSREYVVLRVKFPVYLLFAEYWSNADLWGADTLINRLILLTGLVGGEALIMLSFAISFMCTHEDKHILFNKNRNEGMSKRKKNM